MALTLRRTKGSQLTWDEVDANWTAGRTFDGTVLLAGEAELLAGLERARAIRDARDEEEVLLLLM